MRIFKNLQRLFCSPKFYKHAAVGRQDICVLWGFMIKGYEDAFRFDESPQSLIGKA